MSVSALTGCLQSHATAGTLLADAEHKTPQDYVHNGWVVEALQAAWSAITHAGAAGRPEHRVLPGRALAAHA